MKFNNFIPVSEPILSKEDKKIALKEINAGNISSFGKYNSLFENEFSKFIGCKYGLTVSNGTTALETALFGIGIKENDEIIIPNFTIISCLNAVLKFKATPVFVDIDKRTWNLDTELFERIVSKKTKAVIVCHLFGHPANMKKIMSLKKKYNFKIIEDCAESHGAMFNNKKVGSFGDVSTFSFYSNKIITTGEGGMVMTSNKKYFEKMKGYKNLFFGKYKRFKHEQIGYNFRLTNIQAAIGYSQLKRINKIIDAKRNLGFIYQRYLSDINNVQTQIEEKWAKTVFWMYGFVISNKKISAMKVIKELSKKNIEARPFFRSLDTQPFMKNYNFIKPYDTPVSDYLSNYGMYLPSSLNLKKSVIKNIVSEVNIIINGK